LAASCSFWPALGWAALGALLRLCALLCFLALYLNLWLNL
jgi:hypothetical protein